ncbi:MAG: hypothetical protein ACOYIQ_03360 [Christensenellales bacterium]|jgi:hypothetical protein
MLSLIPCTDKEVLNGLSKEIFKTDFNREAGYILLCDGENAGLAEFTIGKVSRFIRADVKEQYKDLGYRDFFTRAILYRMGQIAMEIEIDYYHSYFEKFGFKRYGKDKMRVDSRNLVFPSDCAHKE